MRIPDHGPPKPPGRAPDQNFTFLLYVFGVLLLLPGVCVLSSVQSGRGPTMPIVHPVDAIVLVVSIVSLLISVCGVLMLVRAVRRTRSNRDD